MYFNEFFVWKHQLFEISFCFKVLFKVPLISTCLCPATNYYQPNDHANL